MKQRKPLICATSIALMLLADAGNARAADGTWTAVAGGVATDLWSDPTAWLNGTIANAAGFTANFATLDITGASAIHLNSARTIGNLTFGDIDITTPAGWTLDNNADPLNVLTLNAPAPKITANGGTGSALTISAVLAGTNGVTFAGNVPILMQGGVGHTYTGDTILTGRVETTNLANAVLSVFGATSNNVIIDGGYFRIFNTQSSTSAGTLANNLIVNTTGTLEYSGRSATTGTLTGGGTLNVVAHYVRADNGGNWSGFTGTINVSSGDAGIADFRQTNYNGFLNSTLNLGANVNFYFTPNQAANGTTALDIGALSGVSSAVLRGGPIGGRVTTFRIGARNLDSEFAGSIAEQATALSNIVKQGTGTLTLSGGTSTYGGPTTINLGTLAVAVMANGAMPSSIGSSANTANNLVIDGGALRYVGSTNSNTDRLFTLGISGATIESSGTGAVNFTNTGPAALTTLDVARPLTLGGSNSGANTIALTIGDSGLGVTTLTKVGIGTWGLTGANSYTGATVIDGGVLSVSTLANGGMPSGVGQSANVAASLAINGGTLRYTGSAASTDRSFTIGSGGATLDASGTGAINFTNTAPPDLPGPGSARTITLSGSNTGNNTLAGQLTNSGAGVTSFVKNGAGTWVLSGANTYTGTTTINAGTLKVANLAGSATGSAMVTVNSGGGLGGNGTIAGPVTVNTGGRIAPGVSVGTLTVGNLTLSSGSILDYEFNASPANDLVAISAASGLTLNGGGFNLFIENTTNRWTTPGTYRLLQYAGAIGGSGINSLSVLNPQSGINYAFGTNAGFVTLTIIATATLSDWISNTGGSWATSTRWSNGVPNAQNDAANFGSALTSPGTVTLDGSKTVGTIQFNNSNSYTVAAGTGGTISLNNGAGNAAQITVIGGSHTISVPLTLTSSVNVDVNNAADVLSLTGVLGGGGGLTKMGNGTLALTGSNTIAAGVTIAAGSVRIGSNLAFGTGNVTFAGSAAIQAGASGLSVANGIVINNAATATLDTQANTLVLTGVISDTNGNGSVTKTGSGTLTMADGNTYRGKTSVTGGAMVVNVVANGGAASSIGQSSSAADNLLIDGGILRYTGSGAQTDRLFTLGVSGGTIEASGSAPLTFSNPGAIVLTGTNAARTLTLAGTNTGANTMAATIGNNGSGATSLVKAGAGTWFLSSANTFSGETVINGGTLALGDSLALQSSTVNYNKQGGTLSFDILGAATFGGVTGSQDIDLNNTLAGAVALTVGANGASTTYSGAFTGAGSLTKAGAGTLSLSGKSTYTGTTTIAGNGSVLKLLVTDALSAGTLVTVNNPGGLQLGNGVTLNSSITAAVGANEFVDVPDAAAVATLGGTLGVGGGGNQFRLGISGAGATLNLTGATNFGNAASIVFLTRGNLTFSGDSSFTSASGVTIGRAAQAINLILKDNANFTLNAASGFGGGQANPSIALTIQDSASFNLSSFTLDVNASSAGTNQTTVNLDGGSLTTSGFFKTNQAETQLTALNFNGGTLRAGGSNPAFLPAFVGLTANVRTGPARIDTNGFDITVALPLGHDAALGATADGGLIKSGAGTLTLEGAHTYTGPTMVAAGTLVVSGTINGGPANVAAGATLGGSGKIGSAAVAGTLTPGVGPGDLTARGAVSFAAGSAFILELNGLLAGTEHDQLTLESTGTLTISGGNIGVALGFAPRQGDVFTVVENTGAIPISGEFANLGDNGNVVLTFGAANYVLKADYQGGDGNDLTLVVVPEPQTVSLLAGVLGGVGFCRRRRR